MTEPSSVHIAIECVYKSAGSFCAKPAKLHLVRTKREGDGPSAGEYFGESFCSEKHMRKYLRLPVEAQP